MFDYKRISDRLRELAFLNSGLKIRVIDHRTETPVEDNFHYEGGIKAFIEYLDASRTPLISPPIYIEGKKGDIGFRSALVTILLIRRMWFLM